MGLVLSRQGQLGTLGKYKFICVNVGQLVQKIALLPIYLKVKLISGNKKSTIRLGDKRKGIKA